MLRYFERTINQFAIMFQFVWVVKIFETYEFFFTLFLFSAQQVKTQSLSPLLSLFKLYPFSLKAVYELHPMQT